MNLRLGALNCEIWTYFLMLLGCSCLKRVAVYASCSQSLLGTTWSFALSWDPLSACTPLGSFPTNVTRAHPHANILHLLVKLYLNL